jgi:hypothetical protein
MSTAASSSTITAPNNNPIQVPLLTGKFLQRSVKLAYAALKERMQTDKYLNAQQNGTCPFCCEQIVTPADHIGGHPSCKSCATERYALCPSCSNYPPTHASGGKGGNPCCARCYEIENPRIVGPLILEMIDEIKADNKSHSDDGFELLATTSVSAHETKEDAEQTATLIETTLPTTAATGSGTVQLSMIKPLVLTWPNRHPKFWTDADHEAHKMHLAEALKSLIEQERETLSEEEADNITLKELKKRAQVRLDKSEDVRRFNTAAHHRGQYLLPNVDPNNEMMQWVDISELEEYVKDPNHPWFTVLQEEVRRIHSILLAEDVAEADRKIADEKRAAADKLIAEKAKERCLIAQSCAVVVANRLSDLETRITDQFTDLEAQLTVRLIGIEKLLSTDKSSSSKPPVQSAACSSSSSSCSVPNAIEPSITIKELDKRPLEPAAIVNNTIIARKPMPAAAILDTFHQRLIETLTAVFGQRSFRMRDEDFQSYKKLKINVVAWNSSRHDDCSDMVFTFSRKKNSDNWNVEAELHGTCNKVSIELTENTISNTQAVTEKLRAIFMLLKL